MQETIPAVLIGAESRDRALDETEAGINALIERRAANAEHKESVEEREESWRESVRQYRAENREANRHAWITHYRTLARNLRTSAARFESKAAALSKTPYPGEGAR